MVLMVICDVYQKLTEVSYLFTHIVFSLPEAQKVGETCERLRTWEDMMFMFRVQEVIMCWTNSRLYMRVLCRLYMRGFCRLYMQDFYAWDSHQLAGSKVVPSRDHVVQKR